MLAPRGSAAVEEDGTMNNVIRHASPVVDLAARVGDGLEVTLFWDRRSGRLWVDVLHVRTGESFRIQAPRAEALAVYYHPFSYVLGAEAA